MSSAPPPLQTTSAPLSFAYGTFRGSVAGVHVAHLRLPTQPRAPAPVVVNLHGGFWKMSIGLHNLSTTELLSAFGSEDVATWDVEYARVDQTEPMASVAGGGWPHTCLDALAAINALTELPAQILEQLDLSRVYLCGHSAGAHLALWLGYVSRLAPADLERLAAHVSTAAGPEAGHALQRGVPESVCVVGVIALAPVTSLAACASAGLSDFHDAACNFLWRLGPSSAAALSSGQLGAACPLALWCDIAAQQEEGLQRGGGGGGGGGGVATATATRPPLRTLLVHGLADTDVPPSFSVALAKAVWTHPCPPPVWLQLLPGADHYAVAGLSGETLASGEREAAALAAVSAAHAAAARGERPAPAALSTVEGGRSWARVAAALRSFVIQDDGTLGALCAATPEGADELLAEAAQPVCARHTAGAIATADPAFRKWADTEPDSAACMARGLRRWIAWVGEAPGEALRSWVDTH
jgi:hypothetical protein